MGVDKEFQRMARDFPVQILSQPGGTGDVNDGPWMLLYDNFFDPEEADAILQSVEGGYVRSTDQGEYNEYGEQAKIVSQGRTSSNAWCGRACESNPKVRNVYERLANVTHIPFGNYENFQVLEYLEHQYYNVHHD